MGGGCIRIVGQFFNYLKNHWWIKAASNQTAKLADNTMGRARCFLKQKNAITKNRMLGINEFAFFYYDIFKFCHFSSQLSITPTLCIVFTIPKSSIPESLNIF